MYFDLGSHREERIFKIDKQGKPWNKGSQIFPLHLENVQKISNVSKKRTDNNYYICWARKVKLHLAVKRHIMALWQQLPEVCLHFFAQNNPFFASSFSLLRRGCRGPAREAEALPPLRGGWRGLWWGAAVAAQATAPCQGALLGVPIPRGGAAGKLRPWAPWPPCLCPSLPSLVWRPAFLAPPRGCLVATGSRGSRGSAGWTWSPLLCELLGFG